MTNNPVVSEQAKLNAEAWDNFDSCLRQIKRVADRLPITLLHRRTLGAMFESINTVAELLEE